MSATLAYQTLDDGTVLIELAGRLDAMGVQAIEKPFNEAVHHRAARVVVDMSGVDYVSSAGIALLLVKGKMLSTSGGLLAVASLGEFVWDIFERTGYTQTLPVYPTVNDALADL